MASVRNTKKTAQKTKATAVATKTLADKGKSTQSQVAKASQAIRPAMTDRKGNTKPGALAGAAGRGATKRAARIVRKAK